MQPSWHIFGQLCTGNPAGCLDTLNEGKYYCLMPNGPPCIAMWQIIASNPSRRIKAISPAVQCQERLSLVGEEEDRSARCASHSSWLPSKDKNSIELGWAQTGWEHVPGSVVDEFKNMKGRFIGKMGIRNYGPLRRYVDTYGPYGRKKNNFVRGTSGFQMIILSLGLH